MQFKNIVSSLNVKRRLSVDSALGLEREFGMDGTKVSWKYQKFLKLGGEVRVS